MRKFYPEPLRQYKCDMTLVVFAVGLATLLPQNWSLLRYQLPLVPFCAAAAAVALDSLRPRWRSIAALLALGVALAASTTQLQFMLSPHPVNLALAEVPKGVPRGQTIARIMREVPPLDESAYPMGPNLFWTISPKRTRPGSSPPIFWSATIPIRTRTSLKHATKKSLSSAAPYSFLGRP